ncbi:MAG: putative (tetraheme) protein [Candidatus Scalindua rubra]|uniref:Putative (Tetraheme) protein n=1 Tax=Candidatus Scalindua rubra TaxID=1872076 RepID=A0A1E3XIS9_9BACT|nr:MAG: putative (tetraheme) protein [Candidatus Scalindua rubra]
MKMIKKRRIYLVSLILACIIFVFIFDRVLVAEPPKPSSLLLEVEELYSGEKKYMQLPFVLEDTHKRPKNGPPLKNVIHKANREWLKKWISNPKKMMPNARMPKLMFNDNEIEAILAYLTSIADKELPKQEWDSYLLKSEDEMSDEDYEKRDKLFSRGKSIWGRARCNICHPIKGEGAVVDVGPDLGAVADKINRDWLYLWVKEPKSYFTDTQMARYRFNDKELRQLVEFIMRDWDFKAEEEEEEASTHEASKGVDVKTVVESSIIPEGTLVEKGKRIIELSRCSICHEIEGIADLLPISKRENELTEGFEKLLNDINCMTCHNIQGKGGAFAPELTHEGSKLKETWIGDFLQKPDIIRPMLKQMPKFNITPEEAETAVKFIEEFFVSKEIPVERFANIEPTEEKINKGKQLYDANGCRSCHKIETGGNVGPNLKRVGDRLENGYIFFHLKDPHREIPDAVEPNYNLTDEEAIAITHFLISCRNKE